jgi:hypothetical protein
MRRFWLYISGFLILAAFFAEIYFFFLFNKNLEDANRVREGLSSLRSISIDSIKIFSGIDVSKGIMEIKEKKYKFESFLNGGKRILKGIDHKAFSYLWADTSRNIDIITKNERGSKDFSTAFSDIDSSIPPMIESLELLEKQYRKEANFNLIIFGAINLLVLLSLPLFFIFLQRIAFFDLKAKRLGVKSLLGNLNKEVEELADEIEEISTKTIKLSLRKSEDGYSGITASLEEMRKKIDSFLRESFLKEGEEFKGSLQNLIDSLSLSLNNIVASTMMEMEKFKELEKNLEKISGKLTFLKKRVAEISFSIKSKEKEI